MGSVQKVKKIRARKMLFLTSLSIILLLATYIAHLKISEHLLLQRLDSFAKRIESLQTENDSLKKENQVLRDLFNLTIEVEVTAYAPLCSQAITGWDYSGDPLITASGEKVVPWQTAAAGRNIPFGSYVLIEGIGLWRINDRGGLIGPRNVDIAVNTTREARNFGRQRLQAIFLSEKQLNLLEEINIYIPLKN